MPALTIIFLLTVLVSSFCYCQILECCIFRFCYYSIPISIIISVKCCCRKICKGIRVLKMHQRACRVVKDLTEETFEFVEENLTGSYNNDNYNEDLDNNITNSIPDVKPEVKLPKSDDQWKDANLFFMVSLPISGLHSLSIDDSIDLMNSTIYNYFHENFGYSEDFISDELANKYKDLPNKSLKANLKF